MQQQTAIVIGDSFNNTLGLIRSLGEAEVRVILILVGHDRLFVSRSRYITRTHRIDSLDEAAAVLRQYSGALLVCSNDKAAKWIDDNEQWLSKQFVTPMRGKRLGNLFEKPIQCALAETFGLTVPKSVIYSRETIFPANLEYPLLLKPADSNHGEKTDIHICFNKNDVELALSKESSCPTYIVQEYINKEFEINMIGVRTDGGTVIPGGIRKIRHYPTIYSACSYGQFLSAADLGVDVEPIQRMIDSTGYRGPFSVEFLHKNGKNYFMEINFRHDGLAYAATAAGANLLQMYAEGKPLQFTVKPTYMMDLSTDFCHVKDGHISRSNWSKDFLKTRCQLNFNWGDPMPTVWYYLNKFIQK